MPGPGICSVHLGLLHINFSVQRKEAKRSSGDQYLSDRKASLTGMVSGLHALVLY